MNYQTQKKNIYKENNNKILSNTLYSSQGYDLKFKSYNFNFKSFGKIIIQEANMLTDKLHQIQTSTSILQGVK